jgi:hypothetical protein
MNPPLAATTPAVCPRGLRRALAGRLWPFLIFLAFWAGIATSRAATSTVITFTNVPSVVSNTYNGVITLQIYGLTNGVTNVVVQKFLDVNTNGILKANDLLVQQFQLTAGQANTFMNGSQTVTVTNFMPGDMSSTPGEIIAPLNFQNGDFMQNLVGQYLYKISSPSGQFNPVTNRLIVTNTFFSSVITGAVGIAGTQTTISNAVVLLFSSNNGLNVQAGTVANSSGLYTIRAPSGNYFIAAAESNFVADPQEVPLFTNATNSVNVSLTPSTTNLTGKVLSTGTNSIAVPGLTGLALDTNNALSLYFTSTNGTFAAPVVSSLWIVPVDNFAAQFAGYLTPLTNTAFVVSNKLVNVTNRLSKATAIFYGTLLNNSGNPMPGVYMEATDNANHQSLGLTDQNGRYVLGVIGETNTWQLTVVPQNNPGLTNTYVFSPGLVETNIAVGQAIEQNFILAQASATISGIVQDIDDHPISGVEVFAVTTNNGVVYQAFSATTDANGDYSLNVISSGLWTVGLNPASLESLGFNNVPEDQSTNLNDSSAIINFSVLVCGEIEILTTNLPDATVGIPYDTTIQATSCQNITNWQTAYGITLTSLYDRTNVIYTNGTPIYSTGGLRGYLLSDFSYGLAHNGENYFSFMTNCSGGAGTTAGNETAKFENITATVNVSAPIASNTTITIEGRTWTTTTPPSESSVGNYQTTLFRVGPDSYTIGDNPLAYVATNGMFMTGSGSQKTNAVGSLAAFFHSLTPGESLNLASVSAYTGTNGEIVWLKHGTNVLQWGQYLISAYGPQTTNLPPGLSLLPSGTFTADLSGTPTTNGTFNFTIEAVDTGTNIAVQTYSLLINQNTNITAPTLSAFVKSSSTNVFQMQISGVEVGLNYTLLMSTNLDTTNWTSIFTTNAASTNDLIIPDSNATNPARFYRIQVGP